MFFQGCTSHGLHLIVKDIFAATMTKKGRDLEPTYPDGLPFESLVQFAVDCTDIVKFFHNHHVVEAKLSWLQKLQKLPALAKPAPTRWGLYPAMLSVCANVRTYSSCDCEPARLHVDGEHHRP
jgi:hypothetical protein